MIMYYRWRRKFAVYCEISRELSLWPLFSVDTCNQETVIDMPWMHVIVTPRCCLEKEKHLAVQEQNDQAHGTEENTTAI